MEDAESLKMSKGVSKVPGAQKNPLTCGMRGCVEEEEKKQKKPINELLYLGVEGFSKQPRKLPVNKRHLQDSNV